MTALAATIDRAVSTLGGPRRARAVLVLSAVLGLDAADAGAISATAGDLQRAFHVGKTEIGLLLTVSQLVGAAATVPFGVLVDRVTRTRLLVTMIGLWAVAMVGGAAAVRSVTRTALQAVAPVLFGFVADQLGGGRRGLQLAFTAMLGPLLASGLILLAALRSYPRDVATAAASLESAGRRRG